MGVARQKTGQIMLEDGGGNVDKASGGFGFSSQKFMLLAKRQPCGRVRAALRASRNIPLRLTERAQARDASPKSDTKH